MERRCEWSSSSTATAVGFTAAATAESFARADKPTLAPNPSRQGFGRVAVFGCVRQQTGTAARVDRFLRLLPGSLFGRGRFGVPRTCGEGCPRRQIAGGHRGLAELAKA